MERSPSKVAATLTKPKKASPTSIALKVSAPAQRPVMVPVVLIAAEIAAVAALAVVDDATAVVVAEDAVVAADVPAVAEAAEAVARLSNLITYSRAASTARGFFLTCSNLFFELSSRAQRGTCFFLNWKY